MNNRRSRTLAIWALVVALCATSVAYAILQTTLSISGSITKKGGTWNVRITDVTKSTTAGGTFTTNPASSGTSLNFRATLNVEGDAVAVRFRVRNEGTLDATLDLADDVILNVGTTSVYGSWSEFRVATEGVTCGLYDATGNSFEIEFGSYDYPDLSSISAGEYSNYYTLKCEYTTQNANDSSIPVSLTLNYRQG